MALGLSVGSGGGNFLPIVKYDARAGRMFRVDREDGVSTPVDITRNFKAVFDFDNLEVGYINFDTGSAPDFVMVPHGDAMPAKPSDKHRQGLRLTLKLSSELGGDVREIAGTSAALIKGIDALHDDYLSGDERHSGKLPVVVLADTVAVESGSGTKKSTNYQPVFEIVGWVKRPGGLEGKAHVEAPAPAPSRSSPPSTGSTKAPPPKARAMADEEDFG